MSILTLPASPKLRRTRFAKLDNSLHRSSVFTRASQTRVFPGARWAATYSLPPTFGDEAREWCAWLLSLRGRSGRFYGYDPDHRTPAGVATGTPRVAGAGQEKTLTLATDGWTPGVAKILKAGDRIAFDTAAGRELRAVIADADSNGTGAATLTLDEPIRTAPANDTPLIIADASCIMMLDQDEVGWDVDQLGAHGFQLKVIEAYGP